MGCAQYSKLTITPVEGKLFRKAPFHERIVIMQNDSSMQVPAYLNEDFFKAALEVGLYESQIRVHEIKFEYGSNPGENYCSSIYRVLLTFERQSAKDQLEQLSIILKTISITSETQFLADIGVYLKEKIMYQHVLPRLEILSKAAIAAPMQTIVLNDLKAEGFVVGDRIAGLDWTHAMLVLQQLAKFHATSMVLAHKLPTIKRHFQKGLLCEDTALKSTTFQHMFGGFLKQLISTSANWEGFESITGHLARYERNFAHITANLGNAKPNDRYVVLNHGDLWTNNFMFAYDDNKTTKKPKKQIFVDFQVCFFGSAGCDINFFLSTSVQLEILQAHRSDLIQGYYNTFAQTLQYLRYHDIPTFNDLQYELRSRELYGLFGLFGFLPMVTMPKNLSEANSIESFGNEDANRKKLEAAFANPNLQALFKYGLRRLNDVGAFQDF